MWESRSEKVETRWAEFPSLLISHSRSVYFSPFTSIYTSTLSIPCPGQSHVFFGPLVPSHTQSIAQSLLEIQRVNVNKSDSGDMKPLVSIETHNHVALLSITIAPSSFIAILVFGFAFLYFYLVSTGHISLRNIASIIHFPRIARRTPPPTIAPPQRRAIEGPPRHKALPTLLAPETYAPIATSEKSLVRLTQQAPDQPVARPVARTVRSFFSFRAKPALPSSDPDPIPDSDSNPYLSLVSTKQQRTTQSSKEHDIPVLRGQSSRRSKLRDADVAAATDTVRVPINPLRLWLLGRGTRPARRGERRQHGGRQHVHVQRKLQPSGLEKTPERGPVVWELARK